MTLKEIQDYGLEMMKDIHAFCVANNIKYTLGGGSMLGAIRHKGFIPWDEDVDVFMLRQDYEKFCSMYKSSHYKLIKGGDSYLCFARVYDDKETVTVSKAPWCDRKTGAWIDVFPLDGAPDDENVYNRQLAEARKLWEKTTYLRVAVSPLSSRKGFAAKMRLMLKKVATMNGKDLRKTVNEFDAVCRRVEPGKSNHYALLVFPAPRANLYNEYSTFDSCVLAPFETEQFYIVRDWDTVLKNEFGDYMQLPPKDKQVPRLENTTFYWK